MVMQTTNALTGWHLTQPGSPLLHNVYIGKGFTTSMGEIASQAGDSGFVSQYQALNSNPAKEAVWERVRRDLAPDRPSRLGALFMLGDREAIELAYAWFANEDRIAVRVEALPPPLANTHRADAMWLNQPETEWENAATCYWQGTATQKPLFEIIVQGKVFFPDWQNPPFGRLFP